MLSKLLFFVVESKKQLRLNDVLNFGQSQAFGFLLILLALPVTLPIPTLGLNILFGGLVVILSFQLLAGKLEPWIPKSFKDVILPFKFNNNSNALIWIARFEKIFHARWDFVFVFKSRLLALFLLLGGLMMCIVFPIVSAVSAIGVLLIGIGLVQRDGLLALLGVLINSVLFSVILYFVMSFSRYT